jgi:dihydrodipicolinate synthase/N-acetylneuraminate lyase
MQVTPFDESGAPALDELARTVAWQVDLGIGSLSALGMAGEFYKLATDELEQVIETVVQAAEPCETVVGVSAPSAEVAARLARRAEAAGADALLVLPPYGVRPSADGLVAYYGAIARAADLPIMVQDGSDEIRAVIPLDVLVRLCREVPAIRWVKVEDVPPNPKITALRQALDDGVTPLCGAGGLGILDAYDRGAVGCISGAATADVFHELDTAYRAGDRAEAEARYRRVLPLASFQCQSIELFVATEKRILARRGLLAGEHVRSPGYALDARECELLDALAAEAGIAAAVAG